MKQKTRGVYLLIITLLLFGAIVPVMGTTTSMPQTHLFLRLDNAWKSTQPGDTFVVRADVKNLGETTAYLIKVDLKNIPDDWNFQQSGTLPWILELEPGKTASQFFIVERGATDTTEIYATAKAYNSPPVTSNYIPIPIGISVIVALSFTGSVLFYREAKLRKKQEKK